MGWVGLVYHIDTPLYKFNMSSNCLSVASLLDLVYKEGLSAAQWREIGIRLELPPSELDVIEKDNRGRSKDCLHEMLMAWLRYDKTATLFKYKNALR